MYVLLRRGLRRQAVALHPEGVDRNHNERWGNVHNGSSPSTRRAWIEIDDNFSRRYAVVVALHPEGVDRNKANLVKPAWADVALHPEGVDRNKESYREHLCKLILVALHPEGVDRNIFNS